MLQGPQIHCRQIRRVRRCRKSGVFQQNHFLDFILHYLSSTNAPSTDSLVDLGLGQARDLLGTILDLAVGQLEAAQSTGALLDVVVACKLVVGDAVQRTVA